jgi:hypothetical protein
LSVDSSSEYKMGPKKKDKKKNEEAKVEESGRFVSVV